MRDDDGSDQGGGSSSGKKCSAYILKIGSVRFDKQKTRKVSLLLGLRNWKKGLAIY